MIKWKKVEIFVERGLFASRWLMAPFYIGLVGGLIALLYVFMHELSHIFFNITYFTPNDAVLASLSMIDLSLAGNLLLIVIFSGYENFVSKFDLSHHEDEPDWKGTVDFSTIKLKLVGSIVAISGIHLLKSFMNIHTTSIENIKWMVIIHLVFVVSGVFLALMDLISTYTKKMKD